jgi:hypothetical protein
VLRHPSYFIFQQTRAFFMIAQVENPPFIGSFGTAIMWGHNHKAFCSIKYTCYYSFALTHQEHMCRCCSSVCELGSTERGCCPS